jgi:hypothetical protein
MDPNLLKKTIEQLEGLEIDVSVFENSDIILRTVSDGLRNSSLVIPRDTQPSFISSFLLRREDLNDKKD